MHPARIAYALGLFTLAAGCGGRSSPTRPTPATQSQSATLSGTVTETAPTASTRIPGATVTIVDGPNAGQSATSDANGVFQFGTLQKGDFTVRANAREYVARVQSVTLTGDQTLTVELDPEFQMVTVTKEESLLGSEAGCGSWDYVSPPGSCMVPYLFNVHHDGPLTVRLTWPDRDTAPVIELYRASNGAATGEEIPVGQGTTLDAHTQYLIEVRKFALKGELPPAGTTTFTLTVTRPN